MYSRDKIVLFSGFILVVMGILTTFFWAVEGGIVALLLISLLVLILLVLQRRQLAKLQQRTLRLQQSNNSLTRSIAAPDQIESVSTKKILGLLQAQQISMEVLDDKVEEIAHERPTQ